MMGLYYYYIMGLLLYYIWEQEHQLYEYKTCATTKLALISALSSSSYLSKSLRSYIDFHDRRDRLPSSNTKMALLTPCAFRLYFIYI